MYPKNNASPEPIAIGAVVQISDGAVQTSGVTVRIKPIGVAEGDGAGTTAYSTDGIVEYIPTQAETNYTSFILIAKKTGCIPVAVTVVTTATGTPGTVNVAAVNSVSTSPVTTIKPVLGLAVDGVITTLTNLPSIPANWLTATGIAADAITAAKIADGAIDAATFAAGAINAAAIASSAFTSAKFATDALDSNALAASFVSEIQSGLSTLTASQAATAVWTDTTAGDFTTALSIGKSIMNGVSLGTGLTVNTLTNAPSDSSGTTTLLTRLTALRAGYLDNINNSTLVGASFPTDPADASDVAGAFSTVNSTLATIAGYIDTEVAAIKAKTDNLPASPASTTNITAASGVSLASTGLNLVVPSEPSGVPSWGVSTIVQWLSWLGAWSRNKVTSTATTQTLRNDADSSDIASITQGDDGTTYTSGEAA